MNNNQQQQLLNVFHKYTNMPKSNYPNKIEDTKERYLTNIEESCDKSLHNRQGMLGELPCVGISCFNCPWNALDGCRTHVIAGKELPSVMGKITLQEYIDTWKLYKDNDFQPCIYEYEVEL